MILIQKDIEEFIEEYSDFQLSYRYSPEVDQELDEYFVFLKWLNEHPHVYMAAGFQEYVGAHNFSVYNKLTQMHEIDDFLRPAFRRFEGQWLIPDRISKKRDEPWSGYPVERLRSYLSYLNLADKYFEWFSKEKDSEFDPYGDEDYWDFYDRNFETWISDKGYNQSTFPKDEEECLIKFPSFDEVIYEAQKVVHQYRDDPTIFVSPGLWTPRSQTAQKTFLQESAVKIIRQIQSEQKDLISIGWRTFEEIVAEIMRNEGMEIHVVKENPQGGRDIIARCSAIGGLESITIAIEVKHRKVVDRPILQQAIYQNRMFPALMLVTSGRFTAGVLKEAKYPENRMRVFLKDGEAIGDLIRNYRLV